MDQNNNIIQDSTNYNISDNKIFTKVFAWMGIGLLITFLTSYLISTNETMLYNIFTKFYIFIVIAEVVTVIILSARIRKLSPMTAKVMFCLYSFLTGLTFSIIFVVYEMSSIIYVFGITAILFFIFAFIGAKTNMDLTKIGTYLFMLLLGIIICEIINIFVGSETFDIVLTIIGLIIFIIYIAYDVNVIKSNALIIQDEDNLAIYGALQLYLDFINIFLKLLRLFGREK